MQRCSGTWTGLLLLSWPLREHKLIFHLRLSHSTKLYHLIIASHHIGNGGEKGIAGIEGHWELDQIDDTKLGSLTLTVERLFEDLPELQDSFEDLRKCQESGYSLSWSYIISDSPRGKTLSLAHSSFRAELRHTLAFPIMHRMPSCRDRCARNGRLLWPQETDRDKIGVALAAHICDSSGRVRKDTAPKENKLQRRRSGCIIA